VKLIQRVAAFEAAGVVRMDFGPGTNVSRVLMDEQGENSRGRSEPGNVSPLTDIEILSNAAGWASQGDLH
jgi:hypothetical protein